MGWAIIQFCLLVIIFSLTILDKGIAGISQKSSKFELVLNKNLKAKANFAASWLFPIAHAPLQYNYSYYTVKNRLQVHCNLLIMKLIANCCCSCSLYLVVTMLTNSVYG